MTIDPLKAQLRELTRICKDMHGKKRFSLYPSFCCEKATLLCFTLEVWCRVAQNCGSKALRHNVKTLLLTWPDFTKPDEKFIENYTSLVPDAWIILKKTWLMVIRCDPFTFRVSCVGHVPTTSVIVWVESTFLALKCVPRADTRNPSNIERVVQVVDPRTSTSSPSMASVYPM